VKLLFLFCSFRKRNSR